MWTTIVQGACPINRKTAVKVLPGAYEPLFGCSQAPAAYNS